MSVKTVRILSSATGLGVYIPSLLISRCLKKQGIDTEVIILESLYKEEKRTKIELNKRAFQDNFSVALMAQKLLKLEKNNFESAIVKAVIEDWARQGAENFIITSGFWMSLIEEYRSRIYPKALNVHLVHLDAVESLSWSSSKFNSEFYRDIWLFDSKNMTLPYRLEIDANNPLQYYQRTNRFVLHGGGWGIGNFMNIMPELNAEGFSLDIAVNSMSGFKGKESGNRYFVIKEGWSPFHKNTEREHIFPPMAQVEKGVDPVFQQGEEYHYFFDIIRNSKGIISKPGGATLIDSLASATPVIFLNPYGDYEKKNSEFWCGMGFGIYYEDWRERGFPLDILENQHKNLIAAREKTRVYRGLGE